MGTLTRWLVLFLLAFAAPADAGPVDRWAEYVAEASARFGIPEAWIRRVMQAESGGRTTLAGRPITSTAGAQGLMQVMPQTWLDMRAAHGLGFDPYETRDNILAGTAYLRAMYDRFGYPGLFAAYNAGPARYADYLAHGRRLPMETVAYVAAVSGRSGERARRTQSPPLPVEEIRRPSLFAIRARDDGPPAQMGSAALSRQPAALFVALRGPGR